MANDIVDRITLLRSTGGSLTAIEGEIAGEQASSLGYHGRQAEASMVALRAFDAAGGGSADARLVLLRKAARDVWAYFVQREMCGMRDHRWVINEYGITDEVMFRLGAVER